MRVIHLASFNSIMVQLELLQKWLERNNIAFQFHYGSIRTSTVHSGSLFVISFNSIMVQLEPCVFNLLTCILNATFNSIMVQLELALDLLLTSLDILSIPLWFN